MSRRQSRLHERRCPGFCGQCRRPRRAWNARSASQSHRVLRGRSHTPCSSQQSISIPPATDTLFMGLPHRAHFIGLNRHETLLASAGDCAHIEVQSKDCFPNCSSKKGLCPDLRERASRGEPKRSSPVRNPPRTFHIQRAPVFRRRSP